MYKWNLLWKVPGVVTGVLLGLVFLLLIVAAGIVVTPSLRTAVLGKAVEVADEKTDWDIHMGRLYLSPFHHSPMVLYRAYKGKEDLPLHLEVDSLFVGHRGQDTLVYVHGLRLRATLCTTRMDSSFASVPIMVDELHLDGTVFRSGDMIEAVGLDIKVGELETASPELVITRGQYPLHGLRLSDTYVGVDLRETEPDTTALETEPMPMAFDVPDGDLRNVTFVLNPLGMEIRLASLATNVLADVGANKYDAHRLDAGSISLTLGNLFLPFDTLYGDACADLGRNMVTSRGLHVRSAEWGAEADLSATAMNLETMRVDVAAGAQFQGSKACLNGFYDIDDEAYDIQMNVERLNLSPFLKDSTHIVVAGDINAEGRGFDPASRAMRSNLKLHLSDCIYENINASGITLDAELADGTVTGTMYLPVAVTDSALHVKAVTEHRFRVADCMTPERMAVDYHAQMRKIRAKVAGEKFVIDTLGLDFATLNSTSLDLAVKGLDVKVESPMHVLRLVDGVQPLLAALGDSAVMDPIVSLSDLTMLDKIRSLVPDIKAKIVLTKGSPVQHIIERMGMDINRIALSLLSDSEKTDMTLEASIPDISHPEDSTALRLPAARASLNVELADGRTAVLLLADTKIADGAMSVHDLSTDVDLCLEVERKDRVLNGTGCLSLDSITLGNMKLGSRTIDLEVTPSERFDNAFKAEVRLEDIPLALVDSILQMDDILLKGAVRAKAVVDGLPGKPDISAEVLPLGVAVGYKPYGVELGLGETPVVMEHNYVNLNGLPIYGADSTFLALTGGVNLDSMRLDIVLAADSFAPAKLVKDGPIPVYGDLAVDIRGRVTGPLDSIVAQTDVTVLPVTDITYPIDKKNLAQVKPYGNVNVRYGVADGSLDLGGRINVDEGFIRYSPKAYPIMPFHVDSGSHVIFRGPVGQTLLDVSASQKVQANVQSEGEDMRRVDFITGVRVKGVVDSIDLGAIGFFLEAPDDEAVSEELASIDEDKREGIAATLLAMGMYMGESNVAAQSSGYALTSIINSRLDAAMTNSKAGKWVDIDISSSQNERAVGKTNDFGVELSKSFFHDRFRISVGASITDNPDASSTAGLYGMASADYKLTKEGNVLLRAFTQRDYNNIIEGDLQKSGIGVRATQEWKRNELYRSDSIVRTYGLTADADIAYRSNNSIGPNLTLKSSVRNLMGKGETFSIKGYGAYYWALRDRKKGAAKMTDTYKLGAEAALIFPYLHWLGDNNPKGDTRYRLGYRYENIAGGYGIHKVSGSFTYFIRSPHSSYITHAFTPFSLSFMHMNAESYDILDKTDVYPQLFKLLAGDEFVPSVSYEFTYNDYRAKRAVNTMFDMELKEAGNLVNSIYSLFGYDWNTLYKPLGKITFDQFLKMSVELHNKFNLTDKICIATRLFAGVIIPFGNSNYTPLSEEFYAGGANGMRAVSSYTYGPGNYFSTKYYQNFFHAGDVKLEANFEFRFPIVWKLFGAVFLDAGNVWNWYSMSDMLKEAGIDSYKETMQLTEELYDGLIGNPYLARQIALGTGAGLRLDIDGLVIRLDLGVGLHKPYQTFWYDKSWEMDLDRPINKYYNIPSFLDAVHLNFGIGYPF